MTDRNQIGGDLRGINILWYGVGIGKRSTVPIIGDALVPCLIGERTTVARDCKKGLEGLFVKVPFRVLS